MATRIGAVDGRSHLEVRVSVLLPAEPQAARSVARRIPIGIDLTVRAAVSGMSVAGAAPQGRGGPSVLCGAASGGAASSG
jgi:hypothetical protein